MLPTDATDALWIAMADVYGHRWSSSYGVDPAAGAGETWARGLAGLTPQQVGQGVDSCIASSDPWPPTLPAFRAMCLGIPSFAAVRLDADKASPFTRLVWEHLDGHRYRTSPADKADRLLNEAYELAREHVMRGGELPEVSGAIEHEKPVVKPAAPEVAERALAEARALLGAKPAPEPEAKTIHGLTPAEELAVIEDSLRRHYHDGKAAAAGDS